MTLDELQGALPGVRLGRPSSATSAAREETIAETCVRQPSYLEHLSTVARGGADRGLAGLAARSGWSAPPRRTSPATFVETNFDFYGRTLSGTPELRARWKRGVAARRGRGRRGGRRASTSPGTSRRASKAMMDELVAQPARGLPRSRSPALDWMSEETKQRAFDKLDTFRPEDRLPREVPRLLRARGRARRPARQRRARPTAFETDRAAGQDRRAGRPRRVVHAAADRQRLLQPGHERDLLPGRRSCRSRSSRPTPSRPRTTAASAP